MNRRQECDESVVACNRAQEVKSSMDKKSVLKLEARCQGTEHAAGRVLGGTIMGIIIGSPRSGHVPMVLWKDASLQKIRVRQSNSRSDSVRLITKNPRLVHLVLAGMLTYKTQIKMLFTEERACYGILIVYKVLINS